MTTMQLTFVKQYLRLNKSTLNFAHNFGVSKLQALPLTNDRAYSSSDAHYVSQLDHYVSA
jgi:hypothetical protein